MRPFVIAGNWKLNPPREAGEQLYREVCDGVSQRSIGPTAGVRVVVCPPAPYLGWMAGQESGVLRGGQDVATQEWGAFTGALSAPLLREFGADFAIVGHSERRHVFGETDAECGDKVLAAIRGGLTPILCVGETDAERDAGETFEVVTRQLQAGMRPAADSRELRTLIVAYEPVWAIGTGRTATPEQAAEVHRYIRHQLRDFAASHGVADSGEDWAAQVPLLYGGSVKPENARGLLSDKDIDGALIGGASLQSSSFLAIVDVALDLRA